jgi:hypothetical protein
MYEIKMHEFTYFLGPPSTVIANNYFPLDSVHPIQEVLGLFQPTRKGLNASQPTRKRLYMIFRPIYY